MKRTGIFSIVVFLLCLCAVGCAYATPAYIRDVEYHSEKPPLLIEGAMVVETDFLMSNIENPVSYRAGGWSYTAGELDGYPVVICRTKVGMANAAAATAVGIEFFRPVAVINQGTAGGHDPALHRGDIVLAQSSFSSDAWRSKAKKRGEGVDYRDIELLGKVFYDTDGALKDQVYLQADAGLLSAALEVKDRYKEGRVVLGTIATTDAWESQVDRILWLHEKFGSSVEEMETYAVAGICQDYEVPFLGIRVLSNSAPNEEKWVPETGIVCQKFVLEVARQYIKTTLDTPVTREK